MTVSPRMWLAAATVAAALCGIARAEPAPDAPPPDEPVKRPHWPWLLLGEQVVLLTPPTIYYYSTTDLQREDFELEWTWEDWKTKLTSFDAVAFDTGNWASNAFRHTFIGAGHYQISRANGLGEVSSTLINVATSALWEYVVEYRERISLNDMTVNSISGFIVGEPLFQIGRLGDRPGASWKRKALGWLTAPVHQAHRTFGYSSWRDPPEAWAQIEVSAGAGISDHGDGGEPDVRTRGEADVVIDPRYGAPGDGTITLGRARMSRASIELRMDREARWMARFNTMTTYGGWYGRDIDERGVGNDWSLTAATGFDYETRPLAGKELDRTGMFHILGPRLTVGRWHGRERHMIVEVGGYGDLGMVQAQVFGPVPPFTPLPQTSVLRVRGYYFASGVTAASRVSITTPSWRARLEGRAQRMWSIDGYDRQELNGAPNDPENVGDIRVWGRATLGVELPGDLGRIEGAVEGSVRRGMWMERRRQTAETDVAIGYSMSL